jgi:TctA family transporter
MSIYRLYFLLASIKFFVWGVDMVGPYDWHDSPSLVVIRDIMPPFWWGIILLVIGVLFMASYIQLGREEKKTPIMDLAIGGAVSICTAWTMGYIAAGFSGDLVSPLVPLFLGFITASHLIITQMPLRDESLEHLRREVEKLNVKKDL